MKHVPQRTCVACRTVRAKRDLIRVVIPAIGTIEVDDSGKLNGRGAYLCAKSECWEEALKSGALNRALRISLTPEDHVYLRAYANTLPDTDTLELD
jgi:predicted RNA-binding protein YlxR (DUF448 family)